MKKQYVQTKTMNIPRSKEKEEYAKKSIFFNTLFLFHVISIFQNTKETHIKDARIERIMYTRKNR